VPEVNRIHALEEVKNEILRERAERAQGGRSQEFVAVIDQVESGLLSYEDWSDQSSGFIYEIFVLPSFREQGIGAKLLLYAENLAIQLGCTRVRLRAHALDHDTDQEWLVSWYAGKGYIQSDGTEVMEKNLATTQT